jgi:hypothetical protein
MAAYLPALLARKVGNALMVLELKISTKYFRAVYEQRKTFEIRYNDRNFQVGDWLLLREIDEKYQYTGEVVFAYVPYLTEDYCKNDYVTMSLSNLLYPRKLHASDIDEIKQEIESGEVWNTLKRNGAL